MTMTNRISTTFLILLTTLSSVCRAFLANRRGNNKWIPLPPVAHSIDTSFSIEQLVAIVDRIVRLTILNTAHPCLYYSYARCRVLRSCGYFVQLNIGLHNLQADQKVEGHCWISRKGQVLFEEKDPHELYSDMMGERDDVLYWTRLKEGTEKKILRMKKE